jgi:predicted FMN-binding regulatory protein PaiB
MIIAGAIRETYEYFVVDCYGQQHYICDEQRVGEHSDILSAQCQMQGKPTASEQSQKTPAGAVEQRC